MDALIFISGLLSLIALIVFFIMASNISTIKTQLKILGITNWYQEYIKRKSFNRPTDEILFALQEYVWLEFMKSPTEISYNNLKERFEPTFASYGADFFEYPYTR